MNIVLISGFLLCFVTGRLWACHYGCKYNSCKGNGDCLYGCKNGYSGSDCSVCTYCTDNACYYDGECTKTCNDGYYDDRCDKRCPTTCTGCDRDFYATKMCTSCSNGYYGNACQFQCSPGCLTNVCAKTNGGCIDGCRTGYNGSMCDICVTGYYKYGVYCIECLDNCQSCSGKYNCDVCRNSMYYDTYCQNSCSPGCKYGKCLKSDGTCHLNCKQGYKGNLCDTCLDNYYWDGYNCNQCPTQCKQCRSSTNCISCHPGYDGQTCDRCLDSYFMQHNQCYKCLDNCDRCSSVSTCTLCDQGYHGETCEQCIDSYYKHNGECFPCPTTCEKCTSSNMCTVCVQGYQGQICDQCESNYYYFGKCNQCPDQCEQCSSQNYCESCSPGFYGQTCIQSCSTGCKTTGCDKSDGSCSCRDGFTTPTCEICVEGKFGNDCEKSCPLTCVSCTTLEICGRCTPGSYGEACQLECSEGCSLECDKYTGMCDSCLQAYSGDRCCVRNQNCRKCASNTECGECNIGFYDTSCESLCPDNCISCTINGTCTSCKDGFYGVHCIDICPEQCKTCQDQSTCQLCKDGYFGTVCDNQCPDTCVSCSSYHVCTQCIDGYSGHTCSYSCSQNCKACSISQYSHCKSCPRGKYMSNSFRYQDEEYFRCYGNCPTYCLNGVCDIRSGECTDGCVMGYTGNKCHCPENCMLGYCQDTSNCLNNNCDGGFMGPKCSCKPGACDDTSCNTCQNKTWYSLSDNCCKCPSTCRDGMCLDDNTCTNGCIDGFYGKSCVNRCLDRDILCLACTDQSCIRCISGYFPVNGQCTKCSFNCVHSNCSSLDGTCLDGCKGKFWGDKCSNTCGQQCKACEQYGGQCTKCYDGKYRRDCSGECNVHCMNTCHIDDGSCNDGCTRNTIHGVTCELDCNTTCVREQCNWQTGKCTKGCDIGYHGEWCEYNCSSNCMDNQEGSTCNSSDGRCLRGCKDGFYAHDCQIKCGANCINSTCERYTGTCTHGCNGRSEGSDCAKALGQSGGDNTGVIAGAAAGGVVFLLVIAAVVVVVLFMRRRRGKKADNTDFSPADNGGHTNIAMDDVGPIYTNSSAAVTMSSELSKPSSASYKIQTPHISLANSLDLESDPDTMGTEEARRSRDIAATDNQPLRAGNELALPIIAAGRESPGGEEYADQPIRGEDDGDTYYNAGAIRRVAVDKLADYVANKFDDDFKQEFGSFPKGLVKPYGVSQMPGNVKRNRYNKVYPYDENRVKLQDATCDYINASYIDGFERKNEYIAALGPTKDTTDCFATVWSMIWQQNVEKLVMLTNLQEGPKMKCHQYWPNPGESETYGDVKVTCMAEDMYAEYTVRTLSATKNKEKRVIYHLHYTGWPDRGVPDDVTGLIEFRNKVLRVKATLDGPVLVHCSAGVGRTGTYIALDYLTNEGDETESVDVFELVSSLRQQRIWMVQAEEQYVYLHDAVVHTLTYDSRPIHSDTFQEHIKSLTSAKLKRMYSHLKSGHSRQDEDEVKAVAKNKTYKNKNNPAADIPGDRYRPRIHLGRTQGECDYINAVYLNSFRFRNHYIVAQTPLSSTVDDFLTLLFQEHIPCIVDMQPHHKPQKNIGEYLPADNQEVTHGDFAIRSMKVKSNNQFTLRRLIITRKSTQGPEERIFHHFQCVSWQDSAPTPPSPEDFINFVREVEAKSKEDFEDAKILIHCLTGAGRSCLFPAVSVMLQKMESEQEVSVVNTIRQIQSRRPGAIPDKEQYLFCHECIRAFLDSFDTYSNFAMR